MPRAHVPSSVMSGALALACLAGCAEPAPHGPPETFRWVRQPVEFSPPPPNWRREGDNSGGRLGVRFILTGGAGEVISLTAGRRVAERDRTDALERLLARRDSLSDQEFVRAVSLARAPTDAPLSETERSTATAINAALDRAVSDRLGGHPSFVEASLQEALAVARSYQPTLAELLPELRLRPERHQEPSRWRVGYERDTVLAGLPAFAGDDTLVTPDDTLLYRQVIWVVKGCPFEATYQGLPGNAKVFERWLAGVRFPGATDAAR